MLSRSDKDSDLATSAVHRHATTFGYGHSVRRRVDPHIDEVLPLRNRSSDQAKRATE